MRRQIAWLAAVMCATNTLAAAPQPANVSSATAVKMAQACIAYARARNAAVNVFIYDASGELLYFQRMDGAPPLGPSFSSGPQVGGDPFRNGPGPVVAIPDTSAVDSVPLIVNGATIASARAAGIGAEGDRACAEIAVEAGKPDR